MMGYFGMHARFSGPFDEALVKVTEALKAEGFGVLTQIDLQGTLKKRLGVDFRRYEILGACNPSSAYRALQQSLDVGLVLPCNVILYEEDAGATHVAAIDPMETLASDGEPALREIAHEVRTKLERVIARVGERVETETR